MRHALDSIYSQYADCFSGACLVQGANETIVAEAGGYASLDYRIPNRLDTKFDTASVTKTYTAAAVLLLVQRGLLRLDDRICSIIDLAGTKIPAEVTIEQLLNHTSGIADDADEEAGEDYAALFVDKPNYALRDCAHFLPQFAYKEPNFQPGTWVRYNNCAFILLGLAIEKTTGMDCRRFIADAVFAPAGMNATVFCAKDEICENRAEGYFECKTDTKTVLRKNIYSYPPIGTPDGGAYTTVTDMDRFIRALKDGKVLSPEHTRMLFTPHCAYARPARIGMNRTGYAFEFMEVEEKIFCMYKEGGNNGVDAILSYFPHFDITISILANRHGVLRRMYNDMRAFVLEQWRKSI